MKVTYKEELVAGSADRLELFLADHVKDLDTGAILETPIDISQQGWSAKLWYSLNGAAAVEKALVPDVGKGAGWAYYDWAVDDLEVGTLEIWVEVLDVQSKPHFNPTPVEIPVVPGPAGA